MTLHTVSLDLSGALAGPYLCPGCGAPRLEPVSDGDRVNLLCAGCRTCWDPELSLMTRVDPRECVDCRHLDACRALRDASTR